MKWIGAISTLGLCLLVAIAVPAHAQEDRHDTPDKSAAQDDKHEQNRDEKRDAPKEEKNDKDRDRAQEQRQDGHSQEQNHDHAQEERRDDHAQKSGRIPDDRFHANFGREHSFRIERPVIVEGRPRFQYSGYWFVIAEPWPTGWQYTDPVYIDYVDGGYYVYNPVHPGIHISINVVF